MLEEEFSEALQMLESEALDSEQVALATYWKKTDALQKYWNKSVGSAATLTAGFVAASAVLGLIGYVLPMGAAFSLMGLISITASVYAMLFGLFAGVGIISTGWCLNNFREMKLNLPPMPENYSEEMGKLSAGLQVKVGIQNTLLLGARALNKNLEEIEAERAQLIGYQLATVKDVYELSEPEEFEQFKLDS